MNWKRRSLVLAGCGLMAALYGCGGGTETTTAPANAPAPAPPADPIKVTMETSKGTIQLELYPDKAPITVENFVQYVKNGQYDGTIFHRVIPGFMIQGGGYTEKLEEKATGSEIKNESDNGLKNDRGTIAMARKSDPDSATSQFYISVADNEGLNYPNAEGHGYTVFGKVTEGMDVVDKIVSVPTTTKELGPMPAEDVPVDPIVIKSVKLAE
ncbi:MAG: peptidylprolyl isomerase [Actinomycetota bacterium]